MKVDDELAGLARQLFDCMRNCHMSLGKADQAQARKDMNEARNAHQQLFAEVDNGRHHDICRTLQAVLQERLDGLGAMVRDVPTSGPPHRG